MNRSLLWGGALLVLLAVPSTGCDELEEAIQGEAAPLKESDLPNCSRIVTCCENTLFQSVAPSAVIDQCNSTFIPAADVVIDNYQTARSEIQGGLANSDQTVEELRTQTQDIFEPGCRCFLEETVGTIGNAALPVDCEVVVESGALDEGATCTDAVDTLLAEDKE